MRRLPAQRWRCHLPIRLSVSDTFVSAKMQEISMGGVLVDVDESWPFGADVKIFMHLPGLETESEINATVRWTQPGAVGLQFGSLRAREVWALEELVRAARRLMESG